MSRFMFIFLSFHLVVVLFVNVNHLLADYYDIYHPLSEKPKFNKLSNPVFDSGIFSIYSAYSGTNSSYGFYAPTVGSEFTFVLGLYKDKKLVNIFTGPELKQQESRLRYSISTIPAQEMFLDTNSVTASYIKVMLHEMGRYACKEIHKKDLSVVAKVRMYMYPTPAQYLAGKKRSTILIKQYEFNDYN